jgi:hypothetical protein
VVWLWVEGLHHKLYMVSMLGGVGVVVGVQYFDVLTGAGVGIEP